MENIKFEITEKDIKKYLNSHKEEYKNREALFIKYLKEHSFGLTRETVQMLLDKQEVSLDLKKLLSNTSTNFSSFGTRPFCMIAIQNLDLSGICHILIPTMKYYNINKFSINQLYVNLERIAEKLVVPINYPMDVISDTLDNYEISGKIEIVNQLVNIKMSRENCKRELLIYEDYYDESKVKRIRKLIREGR